MEKNITGGCACGAIKYETKAKPEFSIICQCRMCQRSTGTGHATAFAVDKELTTIQGDVKYYDRVSDDGNTVNCGFCSNCGNPVLNTTTGAPKFYMFYAATLDDPAIFKPQMVVYSESKQPWDYVDPTLLK